MRETVSAKSRLRHPGILMSKPMLDAMCRDLRALCRKGAGDLNARRSEYRKRIAVTPR